MLPSGATDTTVLSAERCSEQTSSHYDVFLQSFERRNGDAGDPLRAYRALILQRRGHSRGLTPGVRRVCATLLWAPQFRELSSKCESAECSFGDTL